MVSPRTIAFTAPLIALGLLGAAAVRGGFSLAPIVRVARRAGPAAAFVVFAMVSAAWSARPLVTLAISGWAISGLLIAVLGVACVNQEPRRNSFHLAEGLWIGLAAGLIYLLLEISSHQAIKLHIYNALHVPKSWLRPPDFFAWSGNTLVAINPIDLTRSIAPITLLLWPSLMSLRVTAPRGAWVASSLVLFALTAVVVFISEHETSKAAMIAGTIVFLLARWNFLWSARLLRFGWVFACLAVIPVALALHRLDLQDKWWVQPTMQHRIVIWNHAAELAMNAPFLGIGAGVMYDLESAAPANAGHERFPSNARHAHNLFLQTWLELGAVGAAILTLLGLGIVERLQRLPENLMPYAHAAFVSGTTIAAASYGMWQAWFVAMFALAAICLALGVRVNEVRE